MPKLISDIVEKTMSTVGPGNVAIAQNLLSVFFREVQECITYLTTEKTKNPKELGRVLHKLAGACGYFGASELYTQLLTTEHLIKQSSKTEPEEAVQQLIVLLKKTAQAEKKVFEKLGA